MAEFRMPSLGADMESGVLLEWLVRPGDTVHKGDVIAVVDTQKAAIEVECFVSGIVRQLLVEPGTRAKVGTALATIAAETEAGTEAETEAGGEAETAAVPPSPPAEREGPVEREGPAEPEGPVEREGRAVVTSPLVRHLATRLHIDVDQVRGSGVGGRVTHADVERTAAAVAPDGGRRVRASPLARRLAAQSGVPVDQVRGSRADGTVGAADVRRAAAAGAPVRPAEPVSSTAGPQRLAAMRAAIATLMARSKREIPHYYLTETVDLGPAMDWLRTRNRELPVPQRLVASALLLKAAARAAATVGELNGFWAEDRFVPAAAVHLGVAVSLRGGGLIAPAVHDADRRDLADLMAALRDLVTRARAGRLRRAEMSDPTITVSNLGEQGVESILGVIYPPQVALVGFGRVVERPWAVGGLLGIRPTVTVSLAADHRASDGATGARYLQVVAQLLARPEEL